MVLQLPSQGPIVFKKDPRFGPRFGSVGGESNPGLVRPKGDPCDQWMIPSGTGAPRNAAVNQSHPPMSVFTIRENKQGIIEIKTYLRK